jgi:hypothetical protein
MMKTYDLIETEEGATVKRTEADGKEWFIPADPNNSDYAEYLRYTAWVEAGNDPKKFWTADTMSAEKESK